MVGDELGFLDPATVYTFDAFQRAFGVFVQALEPEHTAVDVGYLFAGDGETGKLIAADDIR